VSLAQPLELRRNPRAPDLMSKLPIRVIITPVGGQLLVGFGDRFRLDLGRVYRETENRPNQCVLPVWLSFVRN